MEYVERPFQSESDQITWLKNFPRVKNSARKKLHLTAVLLKYGMFPVECLAVRRPLQLVQEDQRVGTCGCFQYCYKYENLIISLLL